jgi:hypothetical protein
MHFVLLREVLERSLADIHHHLENFAGESERRFIQLRDRRARITPDVEALVGGEVARNLFLEAATVPTLPSLSTFTSADSTWRPAGIVSVDETR